MLADGEQPPGDHVSDDPPTDGNGTAESQTYVFGFHECLDCGSRYNDRVADEARSSGAEPTGSLDALGSRSAPDWEDIFGHPTPYPHQADAIPAVIETAAGERDQDSTGESQVGKGGFSVIEGGCGTGKTMVALTAGVTLVRDPTTRFDKVLVLTSVKQQLRQFEEDLKVINQNLPDGVNPARAITLVGKQDLCPYAREPEGDLVEESVNRECRRLRSQTGSLMGGQHNPASMLGWARTPPEDRSWATAGVDSPYQPEIPEVDAGEEYCPFYMAYKSRGNAGVTPADANDFVLDPEAIVGEAVREGVCPHSAMVTASYDADVVIANYYHAFDHDTLQITHHLVDDSTFVICDEAHMLPERVRDIQSQSVPVGGLSRAAEELAAVHNAVVPPSKELDAGHQPELLRTVVEEALAIENCDPPTLRRAVEVCLQLESLLDSTIGSYLDQQAPGWRDTPSNRPDQLDLPLRDPQTTEQDTVTEWAKSNDISPHLWERLPDMAAAVEQSFRDTPNADETGLFIPAVARLLSEWFEANNTDYFRQMELESQENQPFDTGWRQHYDAQLQLHSVFPRQYISAMLDNFGGGLLMSATLEPLDIYTSVTGIDFLSRFEGRDLLKRQYYADFPAENRCSISLDLPRFTYQNRGAISEDSPVRMQYAKAILTVAVTTPGNVLVCMPSYREAYWAATFLEGNTSLRKPVLLDESSSEAATEELKSRFFSGAPKVLVTSLRGTLTEGVDYDGDKLKGCIVCGVPVKNVDSVRTKAIEHAYTEQFDSAGFEFGLTVPAVRKTRQALGRVIRGSDDVGVRVMADERYTPGGQGSVRGHFPDKDQREYDVVKDLGEFTDQLQGFWNRHQ